MNLFNIPELGMKPKKKQTHPEQPVQKSIVQYLELRGFVFTAPDAGVNVKSKVTRGILKSMGRRSGIADLIVLFSEDRFNHAFYEGKHKGINFSFERAKYIDWIKYTLESEESQLLQGYCSDTGCYEPHRRTAVIKNDKYVVVVEMFYNKKDELCAKFKTAFYANRSFSKISQSPQWNLADCEAYLKKVI